MAKDSMYRFVRNAAGALIAYFIGVAAGATIASVFLIYHVLPTVCK